MKKIILDTDIGIDCDDALAIALLISLERQGKCKISAITASTSREGATATIKAIYSYYGQPLPPLGQMKPPGLSCDKKNVYALNLMYDFGHYDCESESVSVLRKELHQAIDKVTIVTIGPLTNIAGLLKSKPDNISPLSGMELVRQKAEVMFSMAGCFNGELEAEWNVLQDVSAAKYTADNYPGNIVFLPFETGANVLTGENLNSDKNSPLYKSFLYFREFEFPEIEEDGFLRSSWDPLTAYAAAQGWDGYLDISPSGKVFFRDNGESYFIENTEGNHRYFLPCRDTKKMSSHIDGLVGELKRHE